MTNNLFEIFGRFIGNSDRSRKYVSQLVWSVLFKIGSFLFNFLLVRVLYVSLGGEEYGIWLVIFSVVSWFSFMDVGLSHGLRNQFVQAQISKEENKAKRLVSTSFFFLLVIAITLFLVASIVLRNYSLNALYGIESVSNKLLYDLTLIVVASLALQLVLKPITSLYLAIERSSIVQEVNFYTQGISLFFIWFYSLFGNQLSLYKVALILSITPITILMVFNIYGFRKEFKYYWPELRYVSKGELLQVLNLGVSFFLVQISAVILFSTDGLIVSHLFGTEYVTQYQVILKYSSLIAIASGLVVAPLWSASTNAFLEGDLGWIYKSLKKVLFVWSLLCVLSLLLYFFRADVFHIWLGESFVLDDNFLIVCLIFQLVFSLNSIFVTIINGLGKIRIQLYHSVLVSILNIPFSIYLAMNMGLGLSGVLLATLFGQLLATVWAPIQVFKLITRKADGIWNR